jgi:hypothetical protein
MQNPIETEGPGRPESGMPNYTLKYFQFHQPPTPFFVLTTQNPIEMEGTYSLPEAAAHAGSCSSCACAIRRSKSSPEALGVPAPGSIFSRIP